MLEMNTVVEIERKAELMLLTLYNKMNIFHIKLKYICRISYAGMDGWSTGALHKWFLA